MPGRRRGAGDRDAAHRAAAVMPGLWDCHGHFMGARSLDLTRMAQGADGAARRPVSTRSGECAECRHHSVREVGGLGVHLARAVREGILDGPAIYRRARSSAPPEATVTCTGYPLSFVADFAQQAAPCGSPTELPSACALFASNCAAVPG